MSALRKHIKQQRRMTPTQKAQTEALTPEIRADRAVLNATLTRRKAAVHANKKAAVLDAAFRKEAGLK